MFTWLKRYAYAPSAALVLWAVVLAFLPTLADAKETSRANDPQGSNSEARVAGHAVVAAGDSLWSISERQLGPGATPRQIARAAERIHALNRDQIGADPNTIYVGQRFVLPAVLERQAPRQAPEPSRALPARDTAAAVEITPRSAVVKSGPDRASRPTAGESGGRVARATEGADERRALPDEAVVAPVPVVRALAADGAPGSRVTYLIGIRAMVTSAPSALIKLAVTDDRYAGRQLLGWALILMSLSIGAVPLVLATSRAARRVHARRSERRYLNRERKVVGENTKTTDAIGEWNINESLRRSLEGLPLHPDASLEHVLTELERPRVEDELRSVAFLNRRRRLSDIEHRRASALRDLLAVAQHETLNATRVAKNYNGETRPQKSNPTRGRDAKLRAP